VKSKQNYLGEIILLIAAMIWGTAFIFQSIGMDYMGPYMFVTVRSFIAMVVMGITIYLRGQWYPKKSISKLGNKKGYALAVLTGVFLIIAMIVQQIGITGTTSAKAGFLTSFYILFVPLFGITLKTKPTPIIFLSSLIAIVGFYFLSIQDNLGIINPYDVLILVSAVAYAWQILVIDRVGTRLDSLMFSFIQFTVATVISIIPTLIFEGIDFTFLQSPEAIYALLFVGIISSCLAYTFQIIGQKRSKNASVASLIMSLEAVFAALAGFLWLQEIITGFQLLGMALILLAIISVHLPYAEFRKINKKTLTPPINN
jgi:drug/metabolite transporter (DMT)-like permease